MNQRQSKPKRLRCGAALMLAIFVMSVASALVISMLDTQTLRYAVLRNSRDWDQARYLAEAGLNHAFSKLENDIDWRADLDAIEFPVGSGHTYSATVRDGNNGTVIVTATGSAGTFSRVLTATVKQGG